MKFAKRSPFASSAASPQTLRLRTRPAVKTALLVPPAAFRLWPGLRQASQPRVLRKHNRHQRRLHTVRRRSVNSLLLLTALRAALRRMPPGRHQLRSGLHSAPHLRAGAGDFTSRASRWFGPPEAPSNYRQAPPQLPRLTQKTGSAPPTQQTHLPPWQQMTRRSTSLTPSACRRAPSAIFAAPPGRAHGCPNAPGTQRPSATAAQYRAPSPQRS